MRTVANTAHMLVILQGILNDTCAIFLTSEDNYVDIKTAVSLANTTYHIRMLHEQYHGTWA